MNNQTKGWRYSNTHMTLIIQTELCFNRNITSKDLILNALLSSTMSCIIGQIKSFLLRQNDYSTTTLL